MRKLLLGILLLLIGGVVLTSCSKDDDEFTSKGDEFIGAWVPDVAICEIDGVRYADWFWEGTKKGAGTFHHDFDLFEFDYDGYIHAPRSVFTYAVYAEGMTLRDFLLHEDCEVIYRDEDKIVIKGVNIYSENGVRHTETYYRVRGFLDD